MISNVASTAYNNIVISDHAPICIKINLNIPVHSYNWKFNPALDSDSSFREYISKKITDFLDFNDNCVVYDSTVWESFKAVIRGYIISYQSFSKKDRQKRMSEIIAQLPLLEELYYT